MDVEKQPFLNGNEQDHSIESDHDQCHQCQHARRGLRFWTLTVLSHLFFSFLVLQCVNSAPRIRNFVSVSVAQVRQSSTDVLYCEYRLAHSMALANRIVAPASSALKYEVITPAADSWEHSEFFRTPSHELDQRWAEFFKSLFLNGIERQVRRLMCLVVRGISFSKDEAARLNMSSLPLNDGRQAVVLGVYHNLHCLVCCMTLT